MKYIDLYLNRPVASLVVRAVYHTRVTPMADIYFIFPGYFGRGLYCPGEYLYFILEDIGPIVVDY